MRKMTVRVPSSILHCCIPFAGMLERFEIISIFNFTPTVHSEVCNITLTDGTEIERIKGDFITDIIVIRNEGRDYTCLVKGRVSDEISKFINQFDLKLEYPIIFNGITCQFSMIGSPRELHNIVKAARGNGWDFEILSMQRYNPNIARAVSTLTEKQKKILLHAYSSGYFDHPRKINAGQLASKIGIHKTTLLQHLHKAEKQLIGQIVEQLD